MSRLSLKVVKTFMGNCFIITDNETNKNVEVMAKQLFAIVSCDRSNGSLPHGGWSIDDGVLTIHHDEDREDHEVSFTFEEIDKLL